MVEGENSPKYMCPDHHTYTLMPEHVHVPVSTQKEGREEDGEGERKTHHRKSCSPAGEKQYIHK